MWCLANIEVSSAKTEVWEVGKKKFDINKSTRITKKNVINK